MYPRKFKGVLLTLALAMLLAAPVSAQTFSIDPAVQFCFSGSDFLSQDSGEGIFITSVPSSKVAKVYYGDRIIRAGDALPASALDQLTLSAECVTRHNTALTYYTISDQQVVESKSLKLSILPKRNDPPTATDGALETYKNMPNSGQLRASDPENGPLTYELVEQSKRGTVVIETDGAFTYTPDENKVGNDYFTFRVLDEAGNYSEPAKVRVTIRKPTDKEVYADMSGDPDAFAAMWLKDQKIFTGTAVGDHLCFSPDATVSRGEFLVMVMKLVEADTMEGVLTTGFADEPDTPGWLQPYVVSALQNGMITGTATETGVYFYPEQPMTKVEAAVMLQNILQLPEADSTAVFSAEGETVIPVWAQASAAALNNAGIDLQITGESDPLTRRDAAQVLYTVNQIVREDAVSTFFWVQ